MAIAAVVGLVFAAARFGVRFEVDDAIKVETQEENGVIHREIHQSVEEDLASYKAEEIAQGKAIARIETKQEALEEKIDDNKEDLIREIRRAGSGGG